jgi:hypothetical protein
MTKHRLKTAVAIGLAALSTGSLAACGGGGTVVSASAIAKCANARTESMNTLPSSSITQRQVVAKTSHGGWLYQSAEFEAPGKGSPQFDLYIFANSKTAEEAFALIQSAQNPSAEFGAGGTFQRANVVISTDQSPESPVATYAEALLKKCVGAGKTQSFLRSQESQTTSTTGEAATQEPPSSENEPSAGQSPVPGESE